MTENSSAKKNKACFFDRDGVVNVEVDYLHEAEKTVLEKGIVEALKLVHSHGYLAVVVTNQAGVARGKYPEEDIHKVHDKIQELLAEHGEKIDAFYYCPHHPEHTGECACRKPAPGMLLKAAEELNIDLGASMMVGDRLSDVNAGVNAGCKKSYLVRTGYGEKTLEKNPDYAGAVCNTACEACADFFAGEETNDVLDKAWNPVKNFFLPRLNRKFFLRLAIVIVLAVILFKYFLVPCVVSGSSMEPTFDSNGFNFCWRGAYWGKKPQVGDIVVIKYNDDFYFLKRIVAVAGDVVEFREGKLYVNGQLREEPYVKLECHWNMKPVTVEVGNYYVVGDNRSMPIGKHQHGSVRARRIIGKPLF